VKAAHYLPAEDAFEVEFDDGLCFLEPHAAIKRANEISKDAIPVRVRVPDKLRRHFRINYDTGEVAEVSWKFIRELPPTPAQLRAWGLHPKRRDRKRQ
jgi:hypothetical protein